MLDISPTPGLWEDEYRFDWTSPALLSRHDPDVFVAASTATTSSSWG
jgi:hypothetical protein